MILVTGSNGFVGKHLCLLLESQSKKFVPVVRASTIGKNNPKSIEIDSIDNHTNWQPILKEGVKTVVHLAAKVHVFDKKVQALDEYRRVNVSGSVNLARQAAKTGVQRFVYVSTVKVHGEESGEVPFKPDDDPDPKDWYSISKLEAERCLAEVCDSLGMELVIIRPPLIYGKGAKGNFARLVKLVQKGYYFPFGMIKNRRSLIGIDNFCSLINVCLDHPEAPGKIFLASDGQDVSTPSLIHLIAKYNKKPVKLLPVPPAILLSVARILGMGANIKKLIGSLQVDSSATRNLLGWTPPLTLEQGIARSFHVPR